jgi:Fe-S cluster assembly ATP-binding protein
MEKTMLHVQNLHVSFNEKAILRGVDLSIPKGEIHALMGPNGSGKTTLAMALAGNPQYTITEGSVTLEEHDLLTLTTEQRAQKGIFIAFQNPIEISGVNNSYFIRAALNSIQKANGRPDIEADAFLTLMKQKIEDLKLPVSLLKRGMNEGFSGGEKKCNEMLQMLMLDPKLAILDEIDSGLDLDTLKRVTQVISAYRNANKSILLITHYPRLFDYLDVDKIHIIQEGKITQSGPIALVKQLEHQGYEGFNTAKEHHDGTL